MKGTLAPLREVGIRILNCVEHGPHAKTVVRSQGPGAPAPQPVGTSRQLGKEQDFPHAKKLFAYPVHAVLPEFPQRQDGGTTETLSETPGAYGTRSCSLAAQIASYETTSAQVTLSSPEMAWRCRKNYSKLLSMETVFKF